MKKLSYIILAALWILSICVIPFALLTESKKNQSAEVIQETITESKTKSIESTMIDVKEIADFVRNDIPMPAEHQQLLYEACKKTGCAYITALSVCWVETGMRNVKGDNGNSLGYMQIQPKWVQDRMEKWGVTDLMDPYSNFLIGTDILSEYINEYGTIDGLTKYNSGHTGSSSYTQKVLKYREALESEFN